MDQNPPVTLKSVQPASGMTLVEVLVVVVALGVLAMAFLPALSKTGNNRWVACVNHLRQIDYGFHLFANDHQQKLPMQVSTNDGGSQEYLSAKDLSKHFAAASTQLGAPRILTCPIDPRRDTARDFATLNNANLSYFLALDAGLNVANSFLSGDRTLTNISGTSSGTLLLTTNSKIRWNKGIHYTVRQFQFGKESVGHVAFADGSVRRLGQADLRRAAEASSPGTNRILIP